MKLLAYLPTETQGGPAWAVQSGRSLLSLRVLRQKILLDSTETSLHQLSPTMDEAAALAAPVWGVLKRLQAQDAPGANRNKCETRCLADWPWGKSRPWCRARAESNVSSVDEARDDLGAR